MEFTAILVSLVCMFLVLSMKPFHGFLVLLFSVAWIPPGLAFFIGPLLISVNRAIIVAFILKFFINSHLLRNFKINLLDITVVTFFMGTVVSYLVNETVMFTIENRGGYLLDMIMPYVVTRVIVDRMEKVHYIFKFLIYISIPLAFVGVLQCVTGTNVLVFLNSPEKYIIRAGFFRAHGSYQVSILFGLYFSFLIPMTLFLYKNKDISKNMFVFSFLAMFFGCLSSMSSAPLFAFVTSIMILGIFLFRQYFGIILFSFITVCVFLEIFSNRHFYEVLQRFAYSGRTAYYRIGLIEEALGGGMDGHWIFGYGDVGVGGRSPKPDFNWYHQDFVNIYIGVLARYGLVAVLPLMFIHFLMYRYLYLMRNKINIWLLSTLTASMIGWHVAQMTVGVFGKIILLYFIYIALINCMLNIPSPREENNKNHQYSIE